MSLLRHNVPRSDSSSDILIYPRPYSLASTSLSDMPQAHQHGVAAFVPRRAAPCGMNAQHLFPPLLVFSQPRSFRACSREDEADKRLTVIPRTIPKEETL